MLKETREVGVYHGGAHERAGRAPRRRSPSAMYTPVRRRVPLRRTSSSRQSTTAHIRERDSYRVWRRRMRRERRFLLYLQAFYEGVCSQVRRVFAWLVLRPLAAVVHVFYLIFLSPQSHRILIRASLFCALHLSCITAALVAYVSFYRVWVPDMTITKDVALQYTPPTSKPMLPFLDEKTTPPHAYIHLDNLDADFPAWCTGDTSSIFKEDQEYNIALEITVPVNTENTHLGTYVRLPNPTDRPREHYGRLGAPCQRGPGAVCVQAAHAPCPRTSVRALDVPCVAHGHAAALGAVDRADAAGQGTAPSSCGASAIQSGRPEPRARVPRHRAK